MVKTGCVSALVCMYVCNVCVCMYVMYVYVCVYVSIYFMDTGGQPEFHELLPPLLRGPALHLIFFNASHDLTLTVEVHFRHECL